MIKAVFIDFYGTVVHEDGEVISVCLGQNKIASKH